MIVIKQYSSLSYDRILKLLISLDNEFVPKLSDQVDLETYSTKLAKRARFILLENNKDIGLIAYYLNNEFCFITSFAIPFKYQGKGISQRMFAKLADLISKKNIYQIRLEVNLNNKKAIGYYYKQGFKKIESTTTTIILKKIINDQ